MKRIQFRTLLSLLVVATLTSCASAEPQPTTLVIDIPQTKQQMLEGVVSQFEADTGIEVVFVDSLGNSKSSTSDLLFTDTTNLGALVAIGAVTEIDASLSQSLLRGAVETFTKDGKLYGIPFSFETVSLVCHKSLISGDVSSWQELLDKGFEPTYTPGNAFESLFYLSSFQTLETSGQLELDQQTAQLFSNWLQDEGTGFSVADYSVVMESFVSKESSCLVAGPWMAPALEQFELVAIGLPKIGPSEPRSPALSVGLSLSSSATNPDAAKRFLRLLASNEAQRDIYSVTGVLPATSAFASEIDNPLLRALLESDAQVFSLPELSAGFVELSALDQLIIDSLDSNNDFNTVYNNYLEKLGER